MFVSMLECEMCWHDEAVKGIGNKSELKESFRSCRHVLRHPLITHHTVMLESADFHILSQTLTRNRIATYANVLSADEIYLW